MKLGRSSLNGSNNVGGMGSMEQVETWDSPLGHYMVHVKSDVRDIRCHHTFPFHLPLPKSSLPNTSLPSHRQGTTKALGHSSWAYLSQLIIHGFTASLGAPSLGNQLWNVHDNTGRCGWRQPRQKLYNRISCHSPIDNNTFAKPGPKREARRNYWSGAWTVPINCIVQCAPVIKDNGRWMNEVHLGWMYIR
jgi:hypothetical protein